MNYYTEQDIRDIVAGVLAQAGIRGNQADAGTTEPLPVEISARHVHLTREAVEKLFGAGYQLTKKKDLSQPGEFLSGERVKLVTARGELANVAVLGPVREHVQVELSATDSRILGIQAPVRLSGDLAGSADVLIVGPAGALPARECAIIARAHIHMTPEDAARYGVADGACLRLRLQTERPVVLEQVIVRVKPSFKLAAHIDFDEANAAMATGAVTGVIVTGG
jgi:propanediol utilization protein